MRMSRAPMIFASVATFVALLLIGGTTLSPIASDTASNLSPLSFQSPWPTAPPPLGTKPSGILGQWKIMAQVHKNAMDDIKGLFITTTLTVDSHDLWTNAVESSKNIWSLTKREAHYLWWTITKPDAERVSRTNVDEARHANTTVMEDALTVGEIVPNTSNLIRTTIKEGVEDLWARTAERIMFLWTLARGNVKNLWTMTRDDVKCSSVRNVLIKCPENIGTMTTHSAKGSWVRRRGTGSAKSTICLTVENMDSLFTMSPPICEVNDYWSSYISFFRGLWMVTMRDVNAIQPPTSKASSAVDHLAIVERQSRNDMMLTDGRTRARDRSSSSPRPTFQEGRELMATAITLEHAPAPRSPTSIERDPKNIVWPSLFIVFIFFEYVKNIFRAIQWLWMAFDLRVTIDFETVTKSPTIGDGLGQPEMEALQKELERQGFGLVTVIGDGDGMVHSSSYHLAADKNGCQPTRGCASESLVTLPEMLTALGGGHHLFDLLVSKMIENNVDGTQVEARVVCKRQGRSVRVWLANAQANQVDMFCHEIEGEENTAGGSINMAYLKENERYFEVEAVRSVETCYSADEEWVCSRGEEAWGGRSDRDLFPAAIWSLCKIRLTPFDEDATSP